MKNIFKDWKKKFFIISLISLFWFLLRSGTNPTRLRYPCQKAAATQVGTYFLGFIPFVIAGSRKYKICWRSFRKNLLFVIFIFFIVASVSFLFDEVSGYRERGLYEEHVKHAPIGASNKLTGSAVFDGRGFENKIVSVHNNQATDWDFDGGFDGVNYYWEKINQDEVNRMFEVGMIELTGTSTLIDAWNAIIPYQTGDKVAIKINLNNEDGCGDVDEQIDAFPETINAIVDGLISIGVPAQDIWVVEPSKIIFDRIRDGVDNLDVQFFTDKNACGDPNVHITPYIDQNSPDVNLANCPVGEPIKIAQVFVDADHVINVPMLKGHGVSLPTLALKNHYGSVKFENYTRSDMHDYFYPNPNSYCNIETNENILADINNNPNIKDKTRLIIGEGIYGNSKVHWKSVEQWGIFDNDDPNIYFFGVDPVAMSSVMWDYLSEESGYTKHAQLHAGGHYGLGIHEHWDNFQNKQYTSIDYVTIEQEGSLKTVKAGDKVTLRIFGQDCDGDQTDLIYYEVDETNANDLINGGLYGLPASLIFVGDEASFEWIAQWFDDPDGENDHNPEIMFITNCGSSSYDSDILEILP
jgi:hypothetical protein